jgi:four helix bundle protein
MATLERFEDIEGWKKARELTKEVYEITSTGDFSRDFGLRDQIRRASVSIMSNIAEGFERDGNNEFRQYLTQAKGSASEVKAQLYVALDAGYISREQFLRLYTLSGEVCRLLGGFIRYLNQSEIRGNKFKQPEIPTRNPTPETRN